LGKRRWELVSRYCFRLIAALALGLMICAACSGQEAKPDAAAVFRNHVVINEAMSMNGRSLVDKDGEPSDWIEL